MNGSPAIDATALTKRYGQTVAVEDVELTIESGVVYGFLGPNGAGKTTTMRMLTGLVEPTAGTATIRGIPITNRRELVDHIGFLPEEPPLYDQLTGLEQLRFAADLRNLRWDTIAERVMELCDVLDLTADLDRRIDGYSRGMRQKTAFIQAVQHDPAVAFLDEPTSGLDPRAAKTLRERIVSLTAHGTTVFLSTHILPVIEEIADRVGVLHQGHLVAEGPPDDLLGDTTGLDADADTDLEAAFLALTDEPAAGQ